MGSAMSLIGSLEDLGLGDILQIVSLSRKSGLLLLRSDDGDGRIVLQDGLVRAAYVKGEPQDLRALLTSGGFAEPDVVDQALENARQSGRPADEVVVERTGLSIERLDSLRREHVERAVVRMFHWCVGEFSFDVRDEIDERDEELSLPTGINAQFLTMEASRLRDEDVKQARPADDEELRFSGEEVGEGPAPAEAAWEEPAPADEDPRELLALATASESAPAVEVAPEPEAPLAQQAPASPRVAGPLVVIDSELRALEWLKTTLADLFSHIHIFQHCEGGVARIRQYLIRGQVPTVLVSSRVPPDSLTGAADAGGLLRRMRSQAPRMAILVMHDGTQPEPPSFDAADGVIVRPPSRLLGDPRRHAETERFARELRAAFAQWAADPGAADVESETAPRPDPLDDISKCLRDPRSRGDVLTLVLDFAAERFRRVAMFMVREEEAVGIAQRGLPQAGGPDDAAFRGSSVPLEDPAWFRKVIQTGAAVCSGPSDEGDRHLGFLLGGATPEEAYVAPIHSGGRVAALLYADDLPGRGRPGDSQALARVLHEAGLALDRALRERARAEVGASEELPA
jgi:hypothetical protein